MFIYIYPNDPPNESGGRVNNASKARSIHLTTVSSIAPPSPPPPPPRGKIFPCKGKRESERQRERMREREREIERERES